MKPEQVAPHLGTACTVLCGSGCGMQGHTSLKFNSTQSHLPPRAPTWVPPCSHHGPYPTAEHSAHSSRRGVRDMCCTWGKGWPSLSVGPISASCALQAAVLGLWCQEPASSEDAQHRCSMFPFAALFAMGLLAAGGLCQAEWSMSLCRPCPHRAHSPAVQHRG